jgi:hypothetical protein
MGDFAASQIFLELNQFTIQTAQMPMTIYGLQHNVTIMRMLLFLTLQNSKTQCTTEQLSSLSFA